MSLTPEESRLLGGSDIAAILGMSPWKTPLSVYARIVAGAEDEDSGPKRRGRALEQAVLSLYAEETGADLLRPLARYMRPHEPYGWGLRGRPGTRASLDAIAVREVRRVVEVKTAGLTVVREWGEAGTDQIPQHYLFQTTWCAGLAQTAGVVDTGDVDVAALVAGDLRVYHVAFDPELYAMLEEAVERFWKDHVEPRCPPPATEPLKDLGAVAALYPRHTDTHRHWDSLGPPERVAVEEYLRAREEEKAAERRRAEWELKLKLSLAGSSGLVGLPERLAVKRIDWTQTKERKMTNWETLARQLMAEGKLLPDEQADAIAEFTTTKPGARPLNVRPAKEQT